MKGLVDYYIVSLDEVENELREDSIRKSIISDDNLNCQEDSEEEFNITINRILGGL